MKILWIAFIWPEPDSSAAGFRTAFLLEILQRAGYDVRVCSPCGENSYRTRLEELGFRTHSIGPNDPSFDEYLLAFDPGVVVFDRFMIEEQFGWRIQKLLPRAARVLDTVDLQFIRKGRESSFVEEECISATIPDAVLGSDVALREVAAVFRSDLTLLVSEFEQEVLTHDFGVPAYLLQICSFMYRKSEEVVPSFDERRNFVSIGNFSHKPNSDAFDLLHRRIWPEMRGLLQERGFENCELHLFGAYPTREFMRRDDKRSGFRVLGKADNAITCLSRYRVNLAPLRFGAGIKGKIADGWAAGTPCVSTTIGAEGMSLGNDFGGTVSATCEEFAVAAVELYLNREQWTASQKIGLKILAEKFDFDRNSANFVNQIEAVVSNLPEVRRKNSTGKILWSHGYRSTEYFSRWIEVKNELARIKSSRIEDSEQSSK